MYKIRIVQVKPLLTTIVPVLVLVLVFSTCSSPQKTAMNSYPPAILQGKYTYRGASRSGNNITLWIGAPHTEAAHFYLEYGFYGDDGGNTLSYEGVYEIRGNRITLQVTQETHRKWDDSVNQEDTKQLPSTLKIEGEIQPHEKDSAIQLQYAGKTYLLKKEETGGAR